MERDRGCEVVFGCHVLETLIFDVKEEETGRASEANNQLAGLRAVMTTSIRQGQLQWQSNRTASLQCS